MKNSKAKIIIIIIVVILVLALAGIFVWQYLKNDNLDNTNKNNVYTEGQTQTTETEAIVDTTKTTETKATAVTTITSSKLSTSDIESIRIARTSSFLNDDFKTQVSEFLTNVSKNKYSDEEYKNKVNYLQNYIDEGFYVSVSYTDETTISEYVNLLNNKEEITEPAGIGIFEYEMTIFYSNGNVQVVNFDPESNIVSVKAVVIASDNAEYIAKYVEGKIYTCSGLNELFNETANSKLAW